jgi:hypothetical protein
MPWGLFRSPSVKIHLIRGILGLTLLAIALVYAGDWGWWAAIPAVGALVSLGGCPTCWLVGLAGSILDDDPVHLCINGDCHKPKSKAL